MIKHAFANTQPEDAIAILLYVGWTIVSLRFLNAQRVVFRKKKSTAVKKMWCMSHCLLERNLITLITQHLLTGHPLKNRERRHPVEQPNLAQVSCLL